MARMYGLSKTQDHLRHVHRVERGRIIRSEVAASQTVECIIGSMTTMTFTPVPSSR
jgi:hypothetical protein